MGGRFGGFFFLLFFGGFLYCRGGARREGVKVMISWIFWFLVLGSLDCVFFQLCV